MEIYFENDCLAIMYDKNSHAVIAQWTGFVAPAKFEEGMENILMAFRRFHTGKLVNDIRKAEGISPHDQQWAKADWHERAIGLGHNYAATILLSLSNVFAMVDAETTLDAVTVKTGYFEDMETALDWLEQL